MVELAAMWGTVEAVKKGLIISVRMGHVVLVAAHEYLGDPEEGLGDLRSVEPASVVTATTIKHLEELVVEGLGRVELFNDHESEVLVAEHPLAVFVLIHDEVLLVKEASLGLAGIFAEGLA